MDCSNPAPTFRTAELEGFQTKAALMVIECFRFAPDTEPVQTREGAGIHIPIIHGKNRADPSIRAFSTTQLSLK